MSKKLILYLFPLFFVSCISISTIDIQVLEPASDPVTPGISSVILLNRAIKAEGNPDTLYYQPSKELYNQATTEVIFSLAVILNESPGIDYIGDNKLLKIPVTDSNAVPVPLDPDFVINICDSLNADAILSLEVLDMELPDKIKLERKVTETYPVSYYLGEIAVKISAIWRVYEKYDGSPAEEHRWYDTLLWQHASYNANEIPSFLPTQEEAMMEAAYYSALTYARRISPYWIMQQRYYFSRGSPNIRQASGFIENDQPEIAKRIYKDQLDKRNKNIVAAAAYNLALIMELEGDYRRALSWGRRSFQYRRHPVTSDYINILEERLEKSVELDRQLGRKP